MPGGSPDENRSVTGEMAVAAGPAPVGLEVSAQRCESLRRNFMGWAKLRYRSLLAGAVVAQR